MLENDLIKHEKYGLGVIIKRYDAGFYFLTAFNDGITRKVRFDECERAD